MVQKSLGVAIKEHFGLTASEAMRELKTLDANDREYFKAEFAKIGIEIVQK
jgi:hypothetical protein